MISQPILLAMLVTLAAMMIPFWGWGRMLAEVQSQEDVRHARRQSEFLRRQQEREQVLAALLPVTAPEPPAKGKRK